MNKFAVILALALLLVPAIVMAGPTKGCGWEGDPALIYGWNYYDGYPYNQPGADNADIYAGGSITRTLGPYNASTVWTPHCSAVGVPETLCCIAWSKHGWTVTGSTTLPLGAGHILSGAGSLWYQPITITAPCTAHVCDYDTVIAQCVYYNTFLGGPDPACGDCYNPNLRPSTGKWHYNADTLVIHVIEAPPALNILQDTLTLVEQGQTQAYIPFSICNGDPCAPPHDYNYNIKSKGHVGSAINQSGTITAVGGGKCKSVYGIINAGAAATCAHDTLTIIAWSTSAPVVYDTCVQVIHVVEPTPVPLFTVPVVTILVLALILAAAVFMRRRAVSRA